MILVFKTNVSDSSDAQMLQPLLDKHLEHASWSFDLEDCDKILRIDSHEGIGDTVVQLLRSRGYKCEELTD